MRQTFDSNVPWEVALSRRHAAQKPGRKHQHKPPGRIRAKQRTTPFRRQQLERAQRAKFSALVAAFWRGELEVHP